MHNFDETCVSLCHVLQENEKYGRKTANINTENLRSFITVKGHCSVTTIIQPGASIPGGLGQQSPTFLKVGGGLKDWLFQLICDAWIIRRLREKRR